MLMSVFVMRRLLFCIASSIVGQSISQDPAIILCLYGSASRECIRHSMDLEEWRV